MATTFLPVLNEVEKHSLHERQPLPDVYLGLSDDEMSSALRQQRLRSASVWSSSAITISAMR